MLGTNRAMVVEQRQMFQLVEERREGSGRLLQIHDGSPRPAKVAMIRLDLAIEHFQLRRKLAAVLEHGIEDGIALAVANGGSDFVEQLLGSAGLAEVVAATLQRRIQDGVQRAIARTRKVLTVIDNRGVTGHQQRPTMFGRNLAQVGREPVDPGLLGRIHPAIGMQAEALPIDRRGRVFQNPASQVHRAERIEVGLPVGHQPEHAMRVGKPFAQVFRFVKNSGRSRGKLRFAREVMIDDGQRLVAIDAGAANIGH